MAILIHAAAWALPSGLPSPHIARAALHAAAIVDAGAHLVGDEFLQPLHGPLVKPGDRAGAEPLVGEPARAAQ